MKLSSNQLLLFKLVCLGTTSSAFQIHTPRSSTTSSALYSSIYTTSERNRRFSSDYNRDSSSSSSSSFSTTAAKERDSYQTTGVSSKGSPTYFPPKKLAKSRADLEQLNAVSIATTAGTYMEQPLLPEKNNDNDDLSKFLQQWKPILTTSLLITGNTIGAGTLVMPEIAAGPGMAVSTAVFAAAYVMNLLSGLAIAEVAINQYETSHSQVPSSFKEFAQTNLESDVVAHGIAMMSMFVNMCVLAFNLGHLGELFTPSVEIGFAGLLTVMGLTMSSSKLGNVASLAVTGLFATLAALIVPGLASISSPLMNVFWTPGVDATGTTASIIESAGQAAPIILTSMVYQNIVPSVTKILNYDRTKIVATLILGSFLPMMIYELYSFVVLGGGCSSEGTSPLLMTAFAITTIVGSSIACVMSIAEELESYVSTAIERTTTSSTLGQEEEEEEVSYFATSDFAASTTFQQQQQPTPTTKLVEEVEQQQDKDVLFSLPSILASVGVPLAVGLALGNGDDLTASLRLAGSYGSPLLYGAIPALMAWKQRQQISSSSTSSSNLLPGGQSSLALLASGSALFIMEEFSKDIMNGMTSIFG
mmetsp:Transcript_18570/g.28668  ORF Transcript_18570/g.28668 Transcript_18570/m.28668 type:complete len:589 (+) Transcript_18570:180-1946(+)|eukprot:CAMPEP_0195285326 /NCGR_PEP_ID=MMETSP0707-20130614/3196_1 /TAXON_ID=33640 /ORGANISM="Asterionellopsis glacialis, Strain CCMP134" /LENGTH=588 /DNA_ID=CAMNT_0040344801 /DNA_START=79 /DNA_END=1845 /DNA_ORIENTATION=+